MKTVPFAFPVKNRNMRWFLKLESPLCQPALSSTIPVIIIIPFPLHNPLHHHHQHHRPGLVKMRKHPRDSFSNWSHPFASSLLYRPHFLRALLFISYWSFAIILIIIPVIVVIIKNANKKRQKNRMLKREKYTNENWLMLIPIMLSDPKLYEKS